MLLASMDPTIRVLCTRRSAEDPGRGVRIFSVGLLSIFGLTLGSPGIFPSHNVGHGEQEQEERYHDELYQAT